MSLFLNRHTTSETSVYGITHVSDHSQVELVLITLTKLNLRLTCFPPTWLTIVLHKRRVLHSLIGCAMALVACRGAVGQDVSFNRDIRPILSDRCYYCHGFDENHREAELRLDVRDDAEHVWDTQSPTDSLLLQRITSEDPDEVMPPPGAHKRAVSAGEAELIRKWIEQGAVYESHWAFTNPSRPVTPATNVSDAIDYFVGRKHAENALQFGEPALPTKWLRRATLDLTGLPPTLQQLQAFNRSVAFQGEGAYVDAVDRLLASPQYGERMALEWLDVARYADTNGFQMDAYRMNWPWRDWVIDAFNANMPYDQFIVQQIAGDLLENEDGTGPTQEQLIATAFNRNHMINGEGGAIREENLAKNNFDRVETTATAFLGLTVGCCQCHDHKFDPLKQTDYYSLLSFFNQISETGSASKKFSAKRPDRPYSVNYWVDKPFVAAADESLKKQLADKRGEIEHAKKELETRRNEYVAEARRWIQEMRDDPDVAAQRVKPGEYVARFINSADLDNPKETGFRQLIDFYVKRNHPWKAYQQLVNTATAAEGLIQEQIPLVMVMRDDQPRDTFVMLRGNYETLGEKVTPSTPDFLPPLEVSGGDRPTRLTLARWIVSDEHPLASRVAVNRYWQLIFGSGLVTTPDDFGLQGAYPTHPDLLDWLAVEFREKDWNLKSLLKGMLLSRTYRQTAVASQASYQSDPLNNWLARGPRQRLDSRLLRDQALSHSGLLSQKMGGPPVAPYQPAGVWEPLSLNKNHYMQDSGESLYRRSLYTVWRRIVAPTNFFDVPSRQVCSVSQTRTSTPLHALTTLNDITYVEAARVWAESVCDSLSSERLMDDSSKLGRLFYVATGRPASEQELDALSKALAAARKRFNASASDAEELIATGESQTADGPAPPELAAWTTICLLVLNLDETLCK